MTDPIEGQLGSLVMSGWVADAPTGHDEAFLMLTTPDQRAGATMGAVADLLGISVGGAAGRLDGSVVVVGIVGGWARLTIGSDHLERPVNVEWTQVARTRGQVVLVVGAAPMPAGMDPDTYTQRYGDRCGIGLVDLVP